MGYEKEIRQLFFDDDPIEDFAECSVCGEERPVFDHGGIDENGAYILPLCKKCSEEADETY